MDLNYKVTNIFPVPIHQFDVNGFDEIQNQLIDYAYQFKNKDPEGVIYSNHGGWQSPNFDIEDENPAWIPLETLLSMRKIYSKE